MNGRSDVPARPFVPPVFAVRAVEKIRTLLAGLRRKMVPPPVAMVEMITGSWLTQAIGVAARLRVADQLANGPASVGDIAPRVGADPQALFRLLRALAMHGIFEELPDGRFALTALGQTLRSAVPYSMRAHAELIGGPVHWAHWGELLHSVTTGTTAIPKVRGMAFFDYLEKTPEFAAIFNEAMTNISGMAQDALVAAYDFSAFRTIVDVGGGHGRLLAAILRSAPQVRGVLFDLASVTAGAAPVLKEAGVADRVRVVAGSFFDGVPEGGDCYLMKHIIHDWEEPKALAILRNVRKAMTGASRLLMIENVLPAPRVPHFGKLLDLEMLLSVGGRERTAAEYSGLLSRAGLKLQRVVESASPASFIEAAPA